MRRYLGLVVGTKSTEGAICYAEVDKRPVSRVTYPGQAKHEGHYLVRILERILPDEPLAAISDRLLTIIRFGSSLDPTGPPTIVLDISDRGRQLFDYFEARFAAIRIVMTKFTGDLEKESEHDEVTEVGKGWAAIRLGSLLSEFRLHLPNRPDTIQIVKEILDFEIPSGLTRDSPIFKIGSHDSQVSALTLAVHREVRFRSAKSEDPDFGLPSHLKLAAPVQVQMPTMPLRPNYGPMPMVRSLIVPTTIDPPQYLKRPTAVRQPAALPTPPEADDPTTVQDDRPINLPHLNRSSDDPEGNQ